MKTLRLMLIAVMIATPLALYVVLESDNRTSDVVSYARAAATATLAGSASVWLTSRRRQIKDQEDSEAIRAEMVANAAKALKPAGARKERSLSQSVFSPVSDEATLCHEIEIAAEACVRLNRTLGVINLSTPFLTTERRNDAMAPVLAASLGSYVRPTDVVAMFDRTDVTICVCLLPGAKDLHNITERLRLALSKELGAEVNSVHGSWAIYPLDGYTGAELIEVARNRSTPDGSFSEILLPPPSTGCGTEITTGEDPTMQTHKTAAVRL